LEDGKDVAERFGTLLSQRGLKDAAIGKRFMNIGTGWSRRLKRASPTIGEVLLRVVRPREGGFRGGGAESWLKDGSILEAEPRTWGKAFGDDFWGSRFPNLQGEKG